MNAAGYLLAQGDYRGWLGKLARVCATRYVGEILMEASGRSQSASSRFLVAASAAWCLVAFSAGAVPAPAAGSVVWASQFATVTGAFCNPSSVAVDSAGNVYCAGLFNGLTDFDPRVGVFGITPPSGVWGKYVAKLHADGSLAWAKSLGGDASDVEVYGVATDSSGNVYLCGVFSGTVDVDPWRR